MRYRHTQLKLSQNSDLSIKNFILEILHIVFSVLIFFFFCNTPSPQYNYTFAVEESAAKRIRPSLPAGGALAAQ